MALVDQHRAVASPDGRKCLAHPGSAAADHEGVHVDVPVIRGRDAIVAVGEHADARPAHGVEMVNYLDHRRRHDGLERRRGHLDERTGFLDAGGEHAPWPAQDR